MHKDEYQICTCKRKRIEFRKLDGKSKNLERIFKLQETYKRIPETSHGTSLAWILDSRRFQGLFFWFVHCKRSEFVWALRFLAQVCRGLPKIRGNGNRLFRLWARIEGSCAKGLVAGPSCDATNNLNLVPRQSPECRSFSPTCASTPYGETLYVPQTPYTKLHVTLMKLCIAPTKSYTNCMNKIQ